MSDRYIDLSRPMLGAWITSFGNLITLIAATRILLF